MTWPVGIFPSFTGIVGFVGLVLRRQLSIIGTWRKQFARNHGTEMSILIVVFMLHELLFMVADDRGGQQALLGQLVFVGQWAPSVVSVLACIFTQSSFDS
jgi:hypothetical protein